MFCAPGLIFGGIDGVVSLFHVFRPRTRFRRYRRRQVPFLCFALPDTFFVSPKRVESRFHVLRFGLIFGRTEGVGSRLYVLCSWTRCRLYRVRRVPFSCFELPDSFLAVPRALCPVFMFCAPGLGVSGTEGVGPRFHVLRSRTRFRRYRGRRVPFLSFALPNSISMVPTVSGSVFMFCAP
jgi:hypothetical protein